MTNRATNGGARVLCSVLLSLLGLGICLSALIAWSLFPLKRKSERRVVLSRVISEWVHFEFHRPLLFLMYYLILHLVSLFVFCDAFSGGGGVNKEQNHNILSNIASSIFQKDESSKAVYNSPEMILKDLNMKSNMTPKPFYVDPDQLLNIVSASIPLLFRVGSGAFAHGYHISWITPDKSKYSSFQFMDLFQLEESCSSSICDARSSKRRGPIIIYEFEGCPFCRKVREAVSMLSLEVEYRPCPMGGDIFRKEIKQKFGAKATFPYLMDANNGVSMFESDDIIAYLFQAYGDGMVPWTLSRGSIWTTVSAGLAMLSRIGKGNQRKWSTPPTQPLVLWAYEGSPFCKIVREELCELEIAHCQISCPRGSPNRQRLLEKTGRFQVPYLEDPNNGVSLFESSAIIEYIQKMYGLKTSPVKYL